MARQKGSNDRLRAQVLVSIGIVRSTSASRICFVGDTPAKMGAPTLRSFRSPDVLSMLFSLFVQRFQVLKSFHKEVLSSRVRGRSQRLFFPIVFVTLCVRNTARMRAQHIVPLPDISHALRKQFLAGHHHSDTFTGFHCLFSSSDVLRGSTAGLHFASHLKFRPLK